MRERPIGLKMSRIPVNDDSENRADAPSTISTLLERAAACWPEAPAVRDVEIALSYSELDDASRRVAAWLAARGVNQGDRVVIRHPNSVRLAAFLLGTVVLGAVAVPTSPDMHLFQFDSVAADAEAAVVLCAEHEVEALRGLCAGEVIALRQAWDAVLETPAAADHGPARAEDLSLLIYTSGSTASPKGVMCTHGQVAFAVWSISRRLRYRRDDSVFCRLPLSFDYGLYQLLLCLNAGAELQLPEPDNDPGLVRRIREWGSTVIPLVPSLATMLVALARRDRRPLRVRLFTNTGAALEPSEAAALREAFPGAGVCLMFGVTECKRISIMLPDEDLARPGAVGRPIEGTRVEVVDELGRPVPDGETGQFVVHGPHVMQGYWRAPELTASRFRAVAGGTARALYTGDYGHRDEEGYLYFAGRRDDIFKHRGIRVSTLEIEAAALDVEGVAAAAALPPADGRGPALFVVGDIAPGAVLRGLRDRLESAKVPASCLVLPRLPLTANGKTDKRALMELAAKGGHDG